MDNIELIQRLQDAAFRAKDDRVSNRLAALANRLEHQGALFEKPLTASERRVINMIKGA